MMEEASVDFITADDAMKLLVANALGDQAARHMHIQDGFSIVALHVEEPVGLVSVQWRNLPPPLSAAHEGFIDIIEVHQDYRHRGIARHLVELSLERGRAHGAYQVRAWSSEDKLAAIPMWQALGFTLCPAVTVAQGKEVSGFFAAIVL